MATAGLSTIGIKVGYAMETTAGTKPAAFTLLSRINAIGGINLEPEQIDASALEDTITKYIAGRQDTGGSFPITINLTTETKTEWSTLISAYASRTGGKRMWFEICHPDLSDAFFIVAQPPTQIPMPELGQNELMTVEMNLIIESFEGLGTKIVPTAA